MQEDRKRAGRGKRKEGILFLGMTEKELVRRISSSVIIMVPLIQVSLHFVAYHAAIRCESLSFISLLDLLDLSSLLLDLHDLSSLIFMI